MKLEKELRKNENLRIIERIKGLTKEEKELYYKAYGDGLLYANDSYMAVHSRLTSDYVNLKLKVK